MSDELRAPATERQDSLRLLVLVSVVAVVVVAWTCALAWALVRLAVHLAHWLF